MTSRRLILRSFFFHAHSHLGAFLGAAVASAILIGALVVGDSVRESLRRLALLRLGRVEAAMATGDRLFRAELFGGNQASLTFLQVNAAMPAQPALTVPALQLPGVAVSGGGSARANQVQVYGIDARFWTLVDPAFNPGEIPPGGVVLNQPLARQLAVQPGAEILLRVQKPSALSRDAPLAPEENVSVALRLKVHAVITDEQLGRFGLAANQAAPLNAFVPLAPLQASVEAVGRANLLLAGQAPGPKPAPGAAALVRGGSPGGAALVMSGVPGVATNLTDALTRTLQQRWRLEDAELELREVPGAGMLELRTRRVFLDPPIREAVARVLTATNVAVHFPSLETRGVLTYFVNELRVGDRATPYSMVTAAGAGIVPDDLRDDEILISQWLADDVGAQVGDELTLKYYVVGTMRELEERSARFRVRGVYPMDAPGLGRHLMPDFPGMTDAQNCRDWDTGLPIQTDRIRPKDEEYWKQYRGTPKALVTLAAGQRLWSNRFGDLTAIQLRVPQPETANLPTASAVRPGETNRGATSVVRRVRPGYAQNLTAVLTQNLDPALFGLRFQPVREQALAASTQSQDFGQLFLGFSFFLIAAALLLMALLFQFSIEQRATEVGTLLALGFRPAQVRRLLLVEGGVVAVLGAGLGAMGGTWYARAMLRGLATAWNDAVGGTPLSFHAESSTLWLGVGVAALVTVGAMGLALRRQARQPARALLASGADLENLVEAANHNPAGKSSGRRYGWAAAVTGLLALGCVGWGSTRGEVASAGLFFGAGAMLLVAGLAACAAWLVRLAASSSEARLTVESLGIRGATRRRRRSLAVIGLLACGTFLITAMGVFRLDAVPGAQRRSSGTGGFALIGESTQPVLHDLDSAKGREVYSLNTNALAGVSVVAFRVRDGDEASCLNLNRAQQPRLLGVAPEQLARRGAFTFVKTVKGSAATNGWRLLRSAGRMGAAPAGVPAPVSGPSDGEDEVPAIGDQASILWALGKQVGDTIPFQDERGRTFKLRLVGAVANSVLQGNLVIADDEFARRFPSVAGYRMFLVDAPSNRVGQASAELTRGLQDLGLALTPTSDRLAAFNAVQNTYLGTFQVLGGLGLILGSVGLGVLVLRNVLERRGELALLLAVGWQPPTLRRLVLIEHGALLVIGLLIGVVAAGVAVLPTVLATAVALPYRSLAWTLAGVLVNGCLWTWLATRAALRGKFFDALRNS